MTAQIGVALHVDGFYRVQTMRKGNQMTDNTSPRPVRLPLQPYGRPERGAIHDADNEMFADVSTLRFNGHWTREETEQHRDLIIRCVNAHDALVAALQSARRTVAPGPRGLTFHECERLVGIIDAALALARGEATP